MGVEISGLEETIERLRRLEALTGDLRPALLEVGNTVKNTIEESFERGASPFGKVWAPLKRPRKRGGTKILVDSGQLSSRWSVSAGAKSVAVGTNLVYAPVHQYGSKKSKGIPARPFLPVDGGVIEPKTAEAATKIIEEYLDEVGRD